MSLPEFEKLGAFYLGREYDLAAKQCADDLVLYDSRDLVTHAVCVGMTGSGKTGLCLGLLEEAALDGVPAIAIDPKGDLANLLLTFPDLRPEDFRPWINEDDARRNGLDPDDFARRQAESWSRGLFDWGQDGDRIRRLRDAADFRIYTPGSNAGIPISILRSFAAPPPALREDAEALRDRVNAAASSLLGLMGRDGDPVQSREHILLSSIFHHAWSAGRDLDLAALIQSIQQPPFTKLGVMELETVYPAKDRFALAMALNNLVAAPSFAAWTEGEALDIGAMLRAPSGKPRISIVSIAHLGDAERMFIVSLLLSEILAWTRQQPGTSSLRAILYMDEIAGYVPPVANPPSKAPLLTLMKQGRAFGVGVTLATQNPVDLDYKGLSNAGTWFIGRLQTDRDKQRVLDGLEGAAPGGMDRAALDGLISQLGSRVFLMHNVHDYAPTIFETRWCMSYLRGPLTRQQIRQLSMGTSAAEPAASHNPSAPAAATSIAPAPQAMPAAVSEPRPSVPFQTSAPVLPPEVPQYFLPARVGTQPITYIPALMGVIRIHYTDAKAGIDETIQVSRLATVGAGPVAVDWDHAREVSLSEHDVQSAPAAAAAFHPLPVDAGRAKSYDGWRKSLLESIFRTHRLELLTSPDHKLTSRSAESEADFRARIAHAAREERDEIIQRLRTRFAPRVQTLRDRLRRAEQTIQVQREQASAARTSTALSVGTAILGAFLGRKTISAGTAGKAATAARGVSRSAREASDVHRAQENASAVRRQLAALEDEFQKALADVSPTDAALAPLEPLTLKPKKTNIEVRAVMLVWSPHVPDATGTLIRAW